MKKIRQRLLPVLLVCAAIGVSGCATAAIPRVAVFPIDKQDIQVMKKGEAFTPDRDGYFVSDFYFDEIMEAKVEEIKRNS